MPPFAQVPSSNKILDHLESEIRNLNLSQPVLPSHHIGSSQHPSILSSLGSEIVERRVIQLPPIIERIPSSQRSSSSSRPGRFTHIPRPRSRTNENHREERRWRRRSSLDDDSPSSYDQELWDRHRNKTESQRYGSHHGRYRSSATDVVPTSRGRNSSDSHLETRRGYSGQQHSERKNQQSQRRTYQRDNNFAYQDRRRPRSYSPPSSGESWSSSGEQDYSRKNNRPQRQHRSPDWQYEKPPSYCSVEVTPTKNKKLKKSTEQSVNCDIMTFMIT